MVKKWHPNEKWKFKNVIPSHKLPLLHPPTPKVNPLPQSSLWSGRNEIYHSGNEDEINGYGEKEGLPNEYRYEFEQGMLKHVHDLKKDLKEKG